MAEHICDGQWRYYCEECSGLPEAGEKPMTDQDNLRDRIAMVLYTESSEAEDGDVVWESPEAIAEEIESWGRFAQAIIDELRTDEAVERVADWLCEDDNGYKLSGHDEWCQDPACDLVESYRNSARDLIAALLGEDA